MSAEFIDTKVLIYAHDGGAGAKYLKSVELVTRLFQDQTGALSVQILAEFYAASIRKLGMKAEDAENVISDLGSWTIHRPGHADLIRASRLYRQHKLSWWDAMVVNSAVELGCRILWSEDLGHGRRYGTLVVQNPFR
jgi:predicted nucleic acid-binding protein